MSQSQETAGDPVKGGFDPVHAAWFFPLFVLIFVGAFRAFFPSLAEKPELLWFDTALQVRAKAGFAEPLDPTIRFVEFKMNEEMARRFATQGEYATAAGILKTLAELKVRAIALDIIYTYGLEEDQNLLASTIREIEASGETSVVLPISLEKGADPPYILRSLPAVEGDPFQIGVVNAEEGHRWRKYRRADTFEGETFPSLALAALAADRPAPLRPKATSPGHMEWKVIGSNGKPITKSVDDSTVLLNIPHSFNDGSFDRAAGITQRVWSVEELEAFAQQPEGADALRDTIFFVGYDQEVDNKPNAHGKQEAGMFVHGVALNDLLHNRAVHTLPLWQDLTIYAIVTMVVAILFSVIRRKRWIIISALGGIAILLLFGWLATWFVCQLPDSILPALIWSGAVVLEIGRRWTYEQRERTQRDAMLGFYFSPAVLKQVTKDLDMIRPQGTSFAILLSDLRGFTTFCEAQPVERVFELLNRLFGVETDAALRENGSLARFAGDQFLAYWGAPEPCEDAPDRSLRASIEIQKILAEHRANPKDDIDPWLKIGIGLHYGRALVGHVGSRSYRDYNLVGDSVNTTARVESQTKNYGAPILTTGEFMEALKMPVSSFQVDYVTVKGKALPTEFHAVVLEDTPENLSACRAYENAFALYKEGSFEIAAESFRVLRDHPFETVATSARMLTERCDELIAQPPEDWTGVYTLTSK
ncbi:MAG: hypothetical protein CMO55_03835 [Verrucomicrobiales bacterium]|nr:hypothetical protein [Verrucomicrobiales bacterium]